MDPILIKYRGIFRIACLTKSISGLILIFIIFYAIVPGNDCVKSWEKAGQYRTVGTPGMVTFDLVIQTNTSAYEKDHLHFKP